LYQDADERRKSTSLFVQFSPLSPFFFFA